ncbi:HNH endonuclease [Variovorax humicola]|uniref:HNH endonuclease n=1 Tax=Variovorax humicola TaxID=1769758 RepID=A0ABU8WAN0_9BURK
MQKEFRRICVYCRAVDCVSPGVVFGVDHYKPKSKFPHETTNYKNLYYCCSACNSRKGNHWPMPEFLDTQTIPNPCDHQMFKHLRFRQAKVEDRSECGRFTKILLDLNDPKAVAFREHVIHMVDILNKQHDELCSLLNQVEEQEKKEQLSASAASKERHALNADLDKVDNALAMYYGTTPIP